MEEVGDLAMGPVRPRDPVPAEHEAVEHARVPDDGRLDAGVPEPTAVHQVVDGLDPLHGEREALRSLAAAAESLTLDGQHEIAAVAMGGALAVQDQFVDHLGLTGPRLLAALGADGPAVLESEGAELELGHVVARVRDALSSS